MRLLVTLSDRSSRDALLSTEFITVFAASGWLSSMEYGVRSMEDVDGMGDIDIDITPNGTCSDFGAPVPVS